jgi:hypothetical protein
LAVIQSFSIDSLSLTTLSARKTPTPLLLFFIQNGQCVRPAMALGEKKKTDVGRHSKKTKRNRESVSFYKNALFASAGQGLFRVVLFLMQV